MEHRERDGNILLLTICKLASSLISGRPSFSAPRWLRITGTFGYWVWWSGLLSAERPPITSTHTLAANAAASFICRGLICRSNDKPNLSKWI